MRKRTENAERERKTYCKRKKERKGKYREERKNVER